ncbi:MAG: hypothetical protein D6731_08150 [Planctomycetota bacterium]|nr:MAG: hypothetical protein D6731_08150 [Planctomycetota bacterium]
MLDARPPLALLWVPLLWAVSLGPARAQDRDFPAVRLSVRGIAGVEPVGRPRRFVSLSVALENPAPHDRQGTLRVYRVRTPNSPVPEQDLFYERRVEVVGGGRRVEELLYYCQENEPEDRLCVLYEGDDGSRSLPVFPRLRLLGDDIALLAVSSSPVAADAYSRSFQLARVPSAQRTFAVVIERADPQALPRSFAGYDPYDVVLVAGLDPVALDAERARPLLDWVRAGGDLIVSSTGGRGEVPPPLREVLPVAPAPGGGHPARPLTPLRALAPGCAAIAPRPVPVDRVEALPGSTVLAEDSQGPLVVRGRLGSGTVTFVAFPLDAAPLRAWSRGRELFASSLLRPPREELLPPDASPTAPPLEELLMNLSEALESLEPPSALLVAPLLFLYVALVGPLNYLLLRRQRRLHLAQAVAGALALAFCVLFYFAGSFYKGSEALVNQVALVELPTAKGPARVEVLTGYFSTGRGLSEARCPPHAVVGPLAIKSSSRGGRVLQGEDEQRLEALALDTWSLRRFRSLRCADQGHVEAELARSGTGRRVRGTLTNRSSLPLEDPLLLFEDGYLELPALGPGESLRLADPLVSYPAAGQPPALARGLYEDARRRYTPLYGTGFGGSDPYGGDPARRIFHALRARLLRVPRDPDAYPALLCARSPKVPGGVEVAEKARTFLARSVVLCELSVQATPGRQTVRELPARVVFAPAEGWLPTEGSTGTPPVLRGFATALGTQQAGRVTFEWKLPASVKRPLLLDRLVLRWRLSPGPLPLGQALFAWDFRKAGWVALYDNLYSAPKAQNGGQRWPAKESDPFAHSMVDPETGTVRVQLWNRAQNVSVVRMALDVSFRR